ncbi:hypothetical protein WA538_000039 [Blastocystis sp. DL]
MYESTLDESVTDTLMRDAKVIYGKLRIVSFGNVANPEIQKHIEDWDIWGPLLIGIVNALLITIEHESMCSTQRECMSNSALFSLVIITQWVGGFVVTMNSKLLGLNVSLFQMLSSLGYSLFPTVLYNVFLLFRDMVFDRSLVSSLVTLTVAAAVLAWCLHAFGVFMSKTMDKRRQLLVMLPAGLYFCFFLLNGHILLSRDSPVS